MHPVERPHLPAGRLSFGRLVLEAAMITFGVLLALSLESWVEHRKLRAQGREAMAHVRIELTRDAERLRAQMPAQRAVTDSLQTFLTALDGGRHARIPQLALHPAGLSTSAWNSAMATQALVHVEFRLVQSVAGFYEMEKWLARLENNWLQLISEPRGETVEAQQQWASAMMYTMLAYLEIEQVLLTQAEQVIPALPDE